jgi:hypothetical protein
MRERFVYSFTLRYETVARLERAMSSMTRDPDLLTKYVPDAIVPTLQPHLIEISREVAARRPPLCEADYYELCHMSPYDEFGEQRAGSASAVKLRQFRMCVARPSSARVSKADVVALAKELLNAKDWANHAVYRRFDEFVTARTAEFKAACGDGRKTRVSRPITLSRLVEAALVEWLVKVEESSNAAVNVAAGSRRNARKIESKQIDGETRQVA